MSGPMNFLSHENPLSHTDDSHLHGRSNVGEFLRIVQALAIDAASARENVVVLSFSQLQGFFLLSIESRK